MIHPAKLFICFYLKCLSSVGDTDAYTQLKRRALVPYFGKSWHFFMKCAAIACPSSVRPVESDAMPTQRGSVVNL